MTIISELAAMRSLLAAAPTSSGVGAVVCPFPDVGEGAVTAGSLRCLFWKHCRHRTGRPCVGLKGTVVSMPHSEQVVRVSVREIPAAAGPEPGRKAAPARLDLQGLHRLGSFLNCLSKKKSCSPAVKINSPPQSAQVSSRSTNSIPRLPYCGTGGWLGKGHANKPFYERSTRLDFTTLDFRGPGGAAERRGECCTNDRQ